MKNNNNKKKKRVIVYECLGCKQKMYKYFVCPNCRSIHVRWIGKMELTDDIKEGRKEK